ncbi:phosphotransferase [Mycoplasma sp. CSL7475-4]|uniref:phosphotransferase n=1 Tax=Mycoplasma sp. CSL7475-4 TaxID=2973942 RepID=UPI00216ACDC3|nr:phosphotransferase [Mycoplasma sp. CSL7475-4]MCS4536662.1 phosphotransferase [Mycoplasma sp. CSL7475-4]
MEKQIELLKQKIDQKIFVQLSNIEFVYEGFHNLTFTGVYQNSKVQIRLPKSNLVDHSKESKILSQFKSTIYYQDGILIKKWFEGKNIENVELSYSNQLDLIREVKKFHKIKIELEPIDFFYYGEGDKKYQELVAKYSKNKDLVTGHNDLNGKNILINEKGEIKLIDFEWVRKSHPFFDAIALYRNLNIDKELIEKEFAITEEEFVEVTYIYDKFKELAYKKTYSNLIIDDNIKQLTAGYTNISYVKNDLFIQQKRLNGFNHLHNLSVFNNLKPNQKVIYEDEKIIVRKFIQACDIDFNDWEIRKKIAIAIADIHNYNVKLLNNKIYERIIHYVEQLKDHKKYNSVFTQNIKNKIISNAKYLPNDVVSHNDLNRANILLDKTNNIKIIDFEYASLNSKYFDIAYHCSDLDYNTEDEKKFIEIYRKNTEDYFDFDEYYRVKAIVNFYGISWSLTFNPDFDFDWLTKHVLNNLKYLK